MSIRTREHGAGRSAGWTSAAMLGLALSLSAGIAHGQETIARFNGSGPQSTPSFSVDGPWLLNWRAGSDFPITAHIELHLYDAQTSRLVGVALRHTGVGSGQRLIREGGEYRLSVVGSGINWAVEIETAPQPLAELLRQNPDLTEVELVAPNVGLSRDVVAQIRSWSTEDGRSLRLVTDDGRTLSVELYGGAVCPGLVDAQSIFFMTSGLRGTLFNGIVLESGTRCYFGGAVPLN